MSLLFPCGYGTSSKFQHFCERSLDFPASPLRRLRSPSSITSQTTIIRGQLLNPPSVGRLPLKLCAELQHLGSALMQVVNIFFLKALRAFPSEQNLSIPILNTAMFLPLPLTKAVSPLEKTAVLSPSLSAWLYQPAVTFFQWPPSLCGTLCFTSKAPHNSCLPWYLLLRSS